MSSKAEIITFLKKIREEIISSFENFEKDKRFERTCWDHKSGGGGEMAVLRGDVFEKAAVNFSAVEGDNFPMQDGKGSYFATGVSLITHMKNPNAPTTHMNVRYIETANGFWFAGGYDLTPMGVVFDEDSQYFHNVAKEALDSLDTSLYPEYSQYAKEYFYIPHRQKERGIGGIFFDHVNTGNKERDFLLIQKVAQSFIQAIVPIYKKRVDMPYTLSLKEIQDRLRAHYVEFNLIYDRGTKFGFLSGGNPEAILCSMPPSAKW